MSKKTKKAMSMLLVVALIAVIAVGGMLAYLQDSDGDVNVMTLGNVDIEQHEYERATNADGTYKTDATGYLLKEFTQAKPLYPAVTPTNSADWGWESTNVMFGQVGANGGGMNVFKEPNAVDKFVFVENTGKSDTYVRTLIAFEAGSLTTLEEWADLVNCSYHFSWNKSYDIGIVNIDGNNYAVYEYVYEGRSDKGYHENGVLPAGEVTQCSLGQVYMKSNATNEDVEALDGNKNGTYDILVLSQAVQTNGFADAQTALDTAFPRGEANANVPGWFSGMKIPSLDDIYNAPKAIYNGKIYEGEDGLKDAISAANENGGGTIVLSGKHQIEDTLTISTSITLDGDNATITREGYTGTMFTVEAGATLTVEDVTLDGAGATATGNLIATEGNGSIELNEGTVLQNNKGAHAVSLATRGGGTLTLNGAQIINNSSDSGAIWGGGNIVVNEGSKINGNSSTGLAGAIRMVGSCNLTMNGGEICGNTAAGDGGAIWGYGSSTYNFNGGKMSNNESAGTGGAIYTGTSSVINIGGDFEMCDNKAINSGAIRLTDHTSMTMTGGTISGNKQNGESNAFNTWNNSISITGGTLDDNMSYVGGLGLTIGKADINGVINYALSTNHNTAYLAADFNGFKFKVDETNANFANFNFKPATGYTYTAGDETKLVCMNEGYKTYWDAGTGTFRLQAK